MIAFNPQIYELYGSSSSHSGSTGIDPEKSSTNELYGEYNLSKNIQFVSTFYRTNMTDRIKIKSDWSGYENKIPETTQEGVESEINLFGKQMIEQITDNPSSVMTESIIPGKNPSRYASAASDMRILEDTTKNLNTVYKC